MLEINGFDVATRQPLSAYTEMTHDGSTVGGCWIYTGVYADGVNQAARRQARTGAELAGTGMGLGVAANRRLL